MKMIFDTIPGQRFSEDIQLNGAVMGSAVIANRSEFILNGVIDGDLHLEEGAKATVNGTVKGNVFNEGGELKIFGMVNGRVVQRRGKLFVSPKAFILGGVSKE